MRKINTWITIVFIIFIMNCLINYGVSNLSRLKKVEVDALKTELKNQGYLFDDKYINIDYSKKYPFKEDAKASSVNEGIIIRINHAYQKINKYIKKVISNVEDYCNDFVLGKDTFIKLYGEINDVIGNKVIDSEAIVVKVKDDYLTYTIDELDVRNNVNNLIGLQAYLDKINTEMLYVQLPFKMAKNHSLLMSGVDYSNLNADRLIEGIKDQVNYLDYRDILAKKNPNYHELYFKTDHHWLPSTGLMFTKDLVRYLNENYQISFNEEILADQNFTTTTLEDYFFGSQGKKVGLGFSEAEDFDLLTYNGNEDLHLQIEVRGIDETNSFNKVMLNFNQLYKKDLYNLSTFETYAHSNVAYMQVENVNTLNDKKVLVIKDSYSSVVTPFLALGIKHLDVIDLRTFNGSLESFIEETKPDLVLVLYNPSAIVEVNGKDTSNFFYFK